MFSIIVAMGNRREIGKNNRLLWNIPEDLKKFRKITENKTVVMGRKTYESIGKALPNRKNIILSKNQKNFFKDDVIIYNDLYEFIEEYKNSREEIFIIGGGEIYKNFLKNNLIDKLYISHINYENDSADTYFPELDYNKWNLILEEKYEKWNFFIYEKK